eukprot:Platyproteum_vivax@DN558_c0_g1_i1.p1
MKLYLTILVFGLLNSVHGYKTRALRLRNRLESGAINDDKGPDAYLKFSKSENEKINIAVGNVEHVFENFKEGMLKKKGDLRDLGGYHLDTVELTTLPVMALHDVAGVHIDAEVPDAYQALKPEDADFTAFTNGMTEKLLPIFTEWLKEDSPHKRGEGEGPDAVIVFTTAENASRDKKKMRVAIKNAEEVLPNFYQNLMSRHGDLGGVGSWTFQYVKRIKINERPQDQAEVITDAKTIPPEFKILEKPDGPSPLVKPFIEDLAPKLTMVLQEMQRHSAYKSMYIFLNTLGEKKGVEVPTAEKNEHVIHVYHFPEEAMDTHKKLFAQLISQIIYHDNNSNPAFKSSVGALNYMPKHCLTGVDLDALEDFDTEKAKKKKKKKKYSALI